MECQSEVHLSSRRSVVIKGCRKNNIRCKSEEVGSQENCVWGNVRVCEACERVSWETRVARCSVVRPFLVKCIVWDLVRHDHLPPFGVEAPIRPTHDSFALSYD